ncbi:hypothetical protein M8J77_020130 [Diaphorina citri]|nr:hypothetical protein M8J77_020130 [Diaphorina citri]
MWPLIPRLVRRIASGELFWACKSSRPIP